MIVFVFLPLVLALGVQRFFRQDGPSEPLWPHAQVIPTSYEQGSGPSLRGGIAWINSGPITIPELRGKIILLDFWTFCCINCHHVLPDLAKLEEKYKNELVVIGVHTAKFDAERDTENIRRKVAEYRIKHPVVNDANQVIWRRFGVQSWPSLVLIDATGRVVGGVAGEGNYDVLDRTIGELVARHKARGELDVAPLKFSPEMDRPANGPLLYPGKVLADAKGNRLFIADTGHNRIVQTDLEGANAVTIGDGEEGFTNGGYDKARFNRPQGMCLDGEILYVADTENHAIRAVDLKAREVTTVAGTGSQQRGVQVIPFSGPATKTPLSSPWDLIQLPGAKPVYIAMAGPHQIWKLDVGSDTVGVFAGTGMENIVDGPAASANFAQPSGLATDGQNLFVADSEVSGIRVIIGANGQEPAVQTIVGRGLFEFGDHDGRGPNVRLQHCLGLAYANGRLYIADTYNNKVKECDPRTQTVKTLVGAHLPGEGDEPPHFYQPGGLSVVGTSLYVADSNNHKIRLIDLKTKAVKTLSLAGLEAPRLAPRPPSFPNARTINGPAVEVGPGESIKIAVAVPLPKGFKLNAETPMGYLVETPGKQGIVSSAFAGIEQKVTPPSTEFPIRVPMEKAAVDGDTFDIRVSLRTFVCSEPSSLCQIRSFIWNVPVKIATRAAGQSIRLTVETK
jgi:thiol-disulfide isomerase/thioredoxin